MGLERTQGSEAVEHHSRLGTKHVPVHLEQATSGGMKEEIDGFRVGNCTLTRERQRVDTIEG
jgi:hypothetical protein